MEDLPAVLKSVIWAVGIFVAAWIAIRGGRWILRKMLKNVLNMSILYPTFKSMWKVIVIIAAAVVFFQTVIHIPASTMLATVGISGVTLGLAAQGFIRDLLMGMVILATHNFQIGDTITVKNSLTGRVDRITLQHTRLVMPDGTIHIIANSEMTMITVSNEPQTPTPS
ncbi:MAG: mechanosensitive ion channel family protein [Clostridiales bacterium]|nr:mechanosensitive ion channel family protein [Clostridiales bacterium]